jgi:hypothetical protein
MEEKAEPAAGMEQDAGSQGVLELLAEEWQRVQAMLASGDVGKGEDDVP